MFNVGYGDTGLAMVFLPDPNGNRLKTRIGSYPRRRLLQKVNEAQVAIDQGLPVEARQHAIAECATKAFYDGSDLGGLVEVCLERDKGKRNTSPQSILPVFLIPVFGD